jgi:pimeloyl-ACP methyl ester carboxylesterase
MARRSVLILETITPLILVLVFGACTKPQPKPEPAMTQQTTSMWIDGPAGRIHVVDTGAARGDGSAPVVFLPPFAGDATHWASHLAHVHGLGRRALAIDPRGHGPSDPPRNGDYRVPGLAQDVAAVVDRLRLRRFVLVGHSYGASVAGEYAGAFPDRVAALVLVDPPGDNPRLPREIIEPYRQALRTDRYREAVAQYLGTILAGARDETRARILSDLERAPKELVIGETEGVFDYSVVDALARYRAAGGAAVTITSDVNQGPLTLHALLPDLPRRHIAGTSHYIPMDDPAGLQRVLDEALIGAIWRD